MKNLLSTSKVLDKIYKYGHNIRLVEISDIVKAYNHFVKYDLIVKMYLKRSLELILEVIDLPRIKGKNWYFHPIIPPTSDIVMETIPYGSVHYIIRYELGNNTVSDSFIGMMPITHIKAPRIKSAYSSGYVPRNLDNLTKLFTTEESYVICLVSDRLPLSETRWLEQPVYEYEVIS